MCQLGLWFNLMVIILILREWWFLFVITFFWSILNLEYVICLSYLKAMVLSSLERIYIMKYLSILNSTLDGLIVVERNGIIKFGSYKIQVG